MTPSARTQSRRRPCFSRLPKPKTKWERLAGFGSFYKTKTGSSPLEDRSWILGSSVTGEARSSFAGIPERDLTSEGSRTAGGCSIVYPLADMRAQRFNLCRIQHDCWSDPTECWSSLLETRGTKCTVCNSLLLTCWYTVTCEVVGRAEQHRLVIDTANRLQDTDGHRLRIDWRLGRKSLGSEVHRPLWLVAWATEQRSLDSCNRGVTGGKMLEDRNKVPTSM